MVTKCDNPKYESPLFDLQLFADEDGGASADDIFAGIDESADAEGGQGSEGAAEETFSNTQEDGSPEEGQELIFGKFKSLEEAQKAYFNAEAELTRRSQELAQYRQQQEMMQAQQQYPQQQEQYDPNELKRQFLNAFVEDPIGALQAVMESTQREQLQPIYQDMLVRNIDSAVSKLQSKYEDFNQLEDKMTAYLQSNPSIMQAFPSIEQSFEAIYKIVKADMAQQAVQQAKEAGRNEAYANIQAKKGAFSEGSQAKTNSAKTPEQQIIEGILGAGTGGFADL